MQATPAPSSLPNSLPRDTADDETPLKPPPQNVDTAPFGILCFLFEKLQNERRQDRRRKLLETWFTHWRKEKGYDLYPVLRLLLPQKDNDRATYGLKEKNLAKAYIKLIPLGMRDPDAIRLLNWKKPTERASSGDFATVLFEVVNKRSSVLEGSLTIDELNDMLDELCEHSGKQDTQSKILQRLYNRATPEEQKWIVRIILKDMNISVKETTIFSVYHSDAQDVYNRCSNLKKVVWELWDPDFRVEEQSKTIQLFQSFAPMLCKRPTRKIEDTVREMGGTEFIIEEKLDGERMQLHKRGNEYRYSSRKAKDYTYLYGQHVGTGSLTPFIDQGFDSRVHEIILDGEMLVWDPVSEKHLPFGTLKTAALDKTIKAQKPRPCFKVFDLLYLNGQSLIHRSTDFRKKNLRRCIKEVPGRLEIAKEFRGRTAKDVREKMEEVMNNRGEGLVIKHPQAKYVLNGRNLDWIKVKPEYMDDMGETLDLLVVAANYGTRKRSGGASTLICAVVDDRRAYEDDEEPIYSTFVRIGTGFTFADYVWIRELNWKEWDPKNPPTFLQTSKRGQEDKGDIYIEPADSFIVKVKAAEITPSDGYHLGYTMRFPRATAIRSDLSIADCFGATELLQNIKTEKKRKLETDLEATRAKKRKTVAPKKINMLPQYQGVSRKGIDIESGLLEGMTFVVMSDPKSRTGEADKKSLVKQIYSNGGKCAQITGNQANLFVVYGGTVIPYDLKLVINKGKVDVLKPSWLLESIEQGELQPMQKKYFFHATDARIATAEYGDDGSDTEPEEGEAEATQPDALTPPAEKSPSEVQTRKQDVQMKSPEPEEGEGHRGNTQEEEEPDMDPDLAEWFKIDDEKTSTSGAGDDGSATEADSENEDTKSDEEPDFDDWFTVKQPDSIDEGGAVLSGLGKSTGVSEVAETSTLQSDDVKMGETEGAMEYDPDKIFRHLCFYLDSPENATKNGMAVVTKYVKSINKDFAELAEVITSNGGRVVDHLDEVKLTHIIVDKRDISRRLELTQRTSKPKRRYLVTPDFIKTCLGEETLLDEADFVA